MTTPNPECFYETLICGQTTVFYRHEEHRFYGWVPMVKKLVVNPEIGIKWAKETMVVEWEGNAQYVQAPPVNYFFSSDYELEFAKTATMPPCPTIEATSSEPAYSQ